MANPTDKVPAPADTKPASATVTPLQVNTEAGHSIPAARSIGPDGKIQWRDKGGALNSDDTRHLAPGWNLVPTEWWERAKVQDTVKVLLAEKVARLKPPFFSTRAGMPILVEGKAMDAKRPLAAMNERDAVNFISDCLTAPLLQRLLASEDRPEVQVAIRAQMDEIEKPKIAARSAG